jgi:hypothetical protein
MAPRALGGLGLSFAGLGGARSPPRVDPGLLAEPADPIAETHDIPHDDQHGRREEGVLELARHARKAPDDDGLGGRGPLAHDGHGSVGISPTRA